MAGSPTVQVPACNLVSKPSCEPPAPSLPGPVRAARSKFCSLLDAHLGTLRSKS